MSSQNTMSTLSNGTGLHTCVGEEEGFKRRAWGRGRGGGGEVEGEGREILHGTLDPDCRHQWQPQKEQVNPLTPVDTFMCHNIISP